MMGTPLNSTLVPRPVPSCAARVDLDVPRIQLPGHIGDRAGGERHVVQRHRAVGVHLHVARRAARVALGQFELRCLRIARRASANTSPLLPRTLSTGLENSTAPVSLALSALRVVLQAIGADDLVALAHDDIAGQHGVAVDVEGEVFVVGLDGDFVRRLVLPAHRPPVSAEPPRAVRGLGAVRFTALSPCSRLEGKRQKQQQWCGRSLSRHLRTILIRMLKNDARLSLIRSWLTRDLGWRVGRISVASADASFRRYFRVSRGDVDPAAWAPRADTLIVMDAPPGKEDIAPYLKVSSLLEQAGAHVPHVHASDSEARLHRHGRPGRHPVSLAAQDRPRRRQTLRRGAHHARQHPGARPACRISAAALRPRAARARAQSHARVVPRANILGSSSRPKSARC